jgi:hypothetical protein
VIRAGAIACLLALAAPAPAQVPAQTPTPASAQPPTPASAKPPTPTSAKPRLPVRKPAKTRLHARAQAPAPAPAPALPAVPVQAPPPQTFVLPSGLHCVLLENHERPLIRMVMADRWEAAELPQGKEGLGGFLALAMASGGAGPHTRAGFHLAVEGLGMDYRFQARMGAYRWTVVADSRSQEAAMELLTDAVARSAFNGPQVEGERQDLIKHAVASSARERAQARFLWAIGAPEATIPPGVAAVERIEYQDLLDFRRRVVRPELAVLALFGDLNLTQAKQLALMHLGIWGPGPQAPLAAVPPRAGTRPPTPEPRLLAVLDATPGAELWAGASRPAEGSGPAAEALLPLLLARVSWRCFGDLAPTFQLRPELGGRPARCLRIQLQVAGAARERMPAGFMGALEALRRDGFSAEELADARSQWQQGRAALVLHPDQLLERTLDGQLDPGLIRAVDQATLAELNQALRAWLDPQRFRFLLLGADAALVQAAEKAGMAPSTLISVTD